MRNFHQIPTCVSRLFGRAFMTLATIAVTLGLCGSAAIAHPLGNFSINQFVLIEATASRARVRYVVDMAEIPTFQESQTIDKNSDGDLSPTELDEYLSRLFQQYADALVVTVDGERLPLSIVSKSIAVMKSASGLPTLRIECNFDSATPTASLTPGVSVENGVRRFRFENRNYAERLGWREIVVAAPAIGDATIFDSTAYGSTLTSELKTYPEDMLAAPLNERTAEFSWAHSKDVPANAAVLRTRDGRAAIPVRDGFAELIAVEKITPLVALAGLLLAVTFGALHAFSPGHGKTVVGAYLVGSRGTAKHAAFLGLTVTITHTVGVFALGLVTLFASAYVVPEKLLPVLTFVSGALVLAIGLSLFVRRLRAAVTGEPTAHTHRDETAIHVHSHNAHQHHSDHHHQHDQTHPHDHAADEYTHSHDGGAKHSHLPPGADGTPVTWRGLLALGVAGGLLPCPSALVVMLASIAAGRVVYGLVLVLAFSVGLAATLTAVGLAFVYAGRLFKSPSRENKLVRLLPVASALVIACLGAAICYEAMAQSGFRVSASSLAEQRGVAADVAPIEHVAPEPHIASLGAFALLGLGLIFGLKHATEADHVIAISTIVSEQRNMLRAAIVGGLWGLGHTASLLIVGAVVLVLRVAIPERVASWLEFGIALMIIGLGLNALVRALRRREDVHVHRHRHDGASHAHIHFHESGTEHVDGSAADHLSHSHVVSRIGLKPLLVGAAHGLAGSAALTLLVLTQIESVPLGLLYLAVFGLGSVVGMLLMSSLVGLPFALSARRLAGVSNGLRTAAGALSIAFGLWYAYQTGLSGVF
jgi:nickel/cobalt transporter (NicO) family protein